MTGSFVEIRIIVDNTAGAGLVAKHGLAILVRAEGHTLLLDTGQGTALSHNASALGIDLASVDTLILSHGHYDHTGGIPVVVQRRPDIEVYFHHGLFVPRFSVDGRGARQIGMPSASSLALERLERKRLHAVEGSEAIGEKLGVAASIERTTPFEDTGGPFFLDAAGKRPDPIEDDLALWIRTSGGLVVLVGCCHAGIVNTLNRVCRDAGERRVRAVIGGLHLLHAQPSRLDATMAALSAVSPETIIPCHCTGKDAEAAFRRALGGRVTNGRAGLVAQF